MTPEKERDGGQRWWTEGPMIKDEMKGKMKDLIPNFLLYCFYFFYLINVFVFFKLMMMLPLYLTFNIFLINNLSCHMKVIGNLLNW